MRLLIIILLSNLLFAEYRVYQYIVHPHPYSEKNIKSYVVKSTLNPEAFYAYNGGKISIKAQLLRSWICLGNTSKEEYCPSPLEIVTNQEEINGQN